MLEATAFSKAGWFGIFGVALLIALASCGAFADEDSGVITCNPVLQTGCDDPAAPRCTILPGREVKRITGCVPAGSVAEGQACTRTAPGIDDCAIGACVGLALPDGELACRLHCSADADCLPGQSCLLNDGFKFAACTPTCSSAEACPSPTVCHALFYDIATTRARPLPLLLCASVGTGSPGDACGGDSDCEAASVCDPTLHCARLCDETHPCDSLTCTSIGAGINLCK
jgi:hypothetical protein